MGRNVGDDKLALKVELVEPEHEDGGEEVVQQEGRMPRLPCTQVDTMDSRKYENKNCSLRFARKSIRNFCENCMRKN